MATVQRHLSAVPSLPPTLHNYRRRSLDDEKQQASLGTQDSVSRRFVSTQPSLPSWESRVDYVDQDRSGDDFTRPDLVRMLANVKRGDVVVTYDDSRLARDALRGASLIREIAREKGARVFYSATATEAKSKDFTDDLVNVARGSAAEGELVKIRQRTTDGLRERVAGLHWDRFAPFGYVLVDDASTVRRPDPRRPEFTTCKKFILIDERARKIVLRIYEEYARGDGPDRISRRLVADGIPGPRGPWTISAVARILRSPIYRGVVERGGVKVIKVDGGHRNVAQPEKMVTFARPDLRIVPEELADLVASEIQRRTKDRAPGHVVHPLSGWGRCATCGGAIASWTKKSKKGVVYVCDRARRHGGCSVKYKIPVERIEQAVITAIVAQVLSDDLIDEAASHVRAALEREQVRQRQLRGTDTAELEREVAEARAKAKRVARLAYDTDDEAVQADARRFAAEARGLEARLAGAQQAIGIDDNAIAGAEAEVIAAMRARRESLTDRAKLREDLQHLFPARLAFVDVGNGWLITGDIAGTIGGAGCTSQPGPSGHDSDVHRTFAVRVAA